MMFCADYLRYCLNEFHLIVLATLAKGTQQIQLVVNLKRLMHLLREVYRGIQILFDLGQFSGD